MRHNFVGIMYFQTLRTAYSAFDTWLHGLDPFSMYDTVRDDGIDVYWFGYIVTELHFKVQTTARFQTTASRDGWSKCYTTWNKENRVCDIHQM